MSEPEYRLGQWHIVYRPDAENPSVVDADDDLVATIHGTEHLEVLKRSLLVARAPSLRDAVKLAMQTFQLMSVEEWGRATEIAQQLRPYYESLMHGLDDELGSSTESA